MLHHINIMSFQIRIFVLTMNFTAEMILDVWIKSLSVTTVLIALMLLMNNKTVQVSNLMIFSKQLRF